MATPLYTTVLPVLPTLEAQLSAPPQSRVLGDYLLAGGAVSALCLAQAVRMQVRRHVRLGEMLLDQGLLTPVVLVEALIQQAIDRIMVYHCAPRYIGERALALGMILPDQLGAALFSQIINHQRGYPLALGTIFVRQRMLTSDQVCLLLTPSMVKQGAQAH
jgi:hypothetical protein